MKRLAAFVAATASLCLQPAIAGPANDVRTPTLEYGEKEIEFRFGSAREEDGERERAAVIGFGYGATEYWFTEVYLEHEKEDRWPTTTRSSMTSAASYAPRLPTTHPRQTSA